MNWTWFVAPAAIALGAVLGAVGGRGLRRDVDALAAPTSELRALGDDARRLGADVAALRARVAATSPAPTDR